jgi:hypothetical protein
MKRKMHEISTDIMTLQMGLDMKSPEERTIQLQDLFLELFDKEDVIYWLYVDNEKKVDMVKDHINKCKIVLNVIQRDNEQIKDLVINTHESLDSLPKHSIFNPIKIRNSSGAVLVEDESIIPKEYFVLVQEERLDKKRILKELKEGNKIPGVKLVKKPFVSGLKERSHNE